MSGRDFGRSLYTHAVGVTVGLADLFVADAMRGKFLVFSQLYTLWPKNRDTIDQTIFGHV